MTRHERSRYLRVLSPRPHLTRSICVKPHKATSSPSQSLQTLSSALREHLSITLIPSSPQPSANSLATTIQTRWLQPYKRYSPTIQSTPYRSISASYVNRSTHNTSSTSALSREALPSPHLPQ